MVTGLAIPNNLTADDLLTYHVRILLQGLLDRKVKVCSYAADGTGIERGVQKLFTALASDFKLVTIKHLGKGRLDITLKIPLFGKDRHPVAMIQDSKHGGKTYRNNVFSGARLLILGNYVVMYSQFRAIAFEDGPLYNCDVEKLDRQDDTAATRLGSADVLQWLANHYPQHLGPIVYLFIFYELIDAYQNHRMKHVERAQLALRALFFMEMWEDFLEKAGYAKAKHFLSHEACDITHFLIHGLLQLIIIYRDDLDGVYPLLPWLLSTEICKHVFGLCRQIIKDFTMLDFYYMIPKLFIRLREHSLFSKFSDGKERASGYSHTYTDNRDVDLVALSLYPSDEEINDATKTAYEEAENLWTLLGAPSSAPRIPSIRLPSIRAWFTEQEPSEDIATDEEIFSDYDSCVGDADLDNNDEESESAQIQKALNYLETVTIKLSQEENKINDLALAAVSLSVGDGMAMYV